MDTKTEIKEGDPLSEDAPSQNEGKLFPKNATLKTNSDAVLLDNDCDVAIKSETHFSDFGLQNEREFLPVVKYNSDDEMYNKVEIKEEPRWLETETASVCDDDIKDGDFTAVKYARLCTVTVSGDSSGKSPLSSAEVSGKGTCFYNGMHCAEYGSQESDVEEHLHSEQTGKYSDDGVAYIKALYLKQKNLIHNGERLFNICESSFTHLSHLKGHGFMHGDKTPYRCKTCDKSFTKLSSLKMHNWIHEDKKPHKCKTCDKRYLQLSHLKSHNLIHEGKRPHKCETCDKNFTRLSDLKRHHLIHDGTKPHKCNICEKSFAQLSHLKVHSFTHEGKKPHQCGICEKSFTGISELKLHNMIHEGKKPYKCEICEKGFTRLSHLKTHNMIHEGKMPYKCETCEKSFVQLSHLKLHNLIHEGKKAHKCEICRKGFNRLSYLKQHDLMHQRHKAI